MMTKEEATRFAEDWIESWNSHDLERILAHYRDDFVMSSPRIAVVSGEPTGVLEGKDAVRAYWKLALERAPHLQFRLLSTYVGSDSVALHYEGPRGLVVEVFFFDASGQVVKAAANYA